MEGINRQETGGINRSSQLGGREVSRLDISAGHVSKNEIFERVRGGRWRVKKEVGQTVVPN